MLVLHRQTRGLIVISRFFQRSTSTVIQAAAKKTTTGENLDSKVAEKKIPNKSLVATVFESLKNDAIPTNDELMNGMKSDSLSSKHIDEEIINAKTVKELLSIAEGNGNITNKQALKIVSILAEWTSIGRANLNEFENDPRFIKVCRVLGRTTPRNNQNNNADSSNKNNFTGSNNRKSKDSLIKANSRFRNDDLYTVLGIAGDDEAAKLISNLNLPQMVKTMSALAQKKRRSTPLLRSLAFNISSSSEQLDLKQSADVFYSMASLNFPDSVLTAKVCVDIQATLSSNKDKSAVVGSILTSLGLLKYRDLDILEVLSDWIIKHIDICRPQDISAMFLTLGTLNYKSAQLEELKKVTSTLRPEDFPKQSDWLSYIWALCLLKIAEPKHIESVLRTDFIHLIENEKGGLSPNSKMKLLNINSYGKFILNSYKGVLLDASSPVYDVPIAHSKSKQILVNGMLDALRSLMSSSKHVKSLVDSKMGFLIDACCALDSKRNPLPVDETNPNEIKIAIMALDFHDMCHGTNRSINGITSLCFELLEKDGRHVLTVPYNEFSTSEKLLKRVQYLEGKLKNIVNNSKK